MYDQSQKIGKRNNFKILKWQENQTN